MSLNQYVTSANSLESLYITRQEVIETFSTIVADLSGMSTITFGVSPNPSFSTISMASGGLISGFAPIQTSNVIFQVSTGIGFASKVVLGSVGTAAKSAITSSDFLGNTAPMEASAFVAQTGPVLGSASFLTLNAAGINANPAVGGVNLPILSWNGNTGSNVKVSLNNISTINGAVPSFSGYTPIIQTMFGTQGLVTGKSITSGTEFLLTSTATTFGISTGKVYDISVPVSVSLVPSPGVGGTVVLCASLQGNYASGGGARTYCVPIQPGQTQIINTTLRCIQSAIIPGNQSIVVSALQQGPLFSSILGINIQGGSNSLCSVTNIN